MLVLLIIFMVAAPLATVDIPVDLPASTARAQPRPDKPLFLTIKSDLTVSLGNDTIIARRWRGALDRATAGDKQQRVFLRADKTVPYGETDEPDERAARRRLSQGRAGRARSRQDVGMGGGSKTFSFSRWPEAARWGACFALAVAFHAVGAAALFARWSEEFQSGRKRARDHGRSCSGCGFAQHHANRCSDRAETAGSRTRAATRKTDREDRAAARSASRAGRGDAAAQAGRETEREKTEAEACERCERAEHGRAAGRRAWPRRCRAPRRATPTRCQTGHRNSWQRSSARRDIHRRHAATTAPRSLPSTSIVRAVCITRASRAAPAPASSTTRLSRWCSARSRCRHRLLKSRARKFRSLCRSATTRAERKQLS